MEISSLLPSRSTVNGILNTGYREPPTLPAVAVKLLEMTQDEKVSAVDLAKVIETESIVAAKLLKTVNSPLYGFRQEISQVSQAVSLLGFSAVRSLCLGIALYERLVRADRAADFDQIFFWQHCLSVAGLCRALAEEIRYPDPEQAYVAGLIHDVGKIILNINGRITYGDFLKNLKKIDGLIVEQERRIIGLGHDELGAYFCNDWNLPAPIVLAAGNHHRRFSNLGLAQEDARLIAIVSFANYLAWIQGFGSVNILRHPIVQPEVAEIIEVERLDLNTLISRMDQEVQKTAELYNFIFPTSAQLRENLLRANIELGLINTRYYYFHGNKNKGNESLNSLRQSLRRPYQNLEPGKIIQSTLDAIHREFQFDRLYVMKIGRKGRNLISQGYLDSTTPATDLSSLEFRITPGSEGFIHCLRKRQAVLITGKTQDEAMLLKAMRIKEMGVVPLSNNNRICGIIGMDNISSGRAIGFEALSAVAGVASELGMALENVMAINAVQQGTGKLDQLTQLFNRPSTEAVLSRAIYRGINSSRKLSIAIIDVDHFEKFNDRFGHLAGDSILKFLADTLKKFSRPTDVLGRYGGDEFMIILKDTGITYAVQCVERIRQEVERLGNLLSMRFKGHALTISIGLATFDSSMKTKDELIAKAQGALFMAKETGRNKVMSISGRRKENEIKVKNDLERRPFLGAW